MGKFLVISTNLRKLSQLRILAPAFSLGCVTSAFASSRYCMTAASEAGRLSPWRSPISITKSGGLIACVWAGRH